MGSGADRPTDFEFSENVPPLFNCHREYAVYHDDIELCPNLTLLLSSKHRPAILGHLQSEAKTAAKRIPTEDLCCESGMKLILKRLDKEYAVDKTNKLGSDVAELLDYS